MDLKKYFALVFGVFLLTVSIVISQDDADNENEEGDEESDAAAEEDAGKIKKDGDVLILTNENFDDAIENNQFVLVEFYAPWCGHCKTLEPEYAAAASILKTMGQDEDTPNVVLAKVDATAEPELAQRFDVSGYPTLKWFKDGQPNDYEGPREKMGIVQYMQEKTDPNYKPPPESVLTLTKDNFDETVNDADLILVEFYAPWCGHCKQLAPEYEKAAKRLETADPPIPLAKVDATTEPDLAKRFDVSGYPTLKLFRKGKDYEYKGPREQYGIYDYMLKQSGEASKELKSTKEIKGNMEVTDVTIVGFFENADDKLYLTYQEAANDMREDFSFYHTFDASARDAYKTNAGSIVVFLPERFQSKYEQKWVALSNVDSSTEEVTKFFKENSIPLLGEMTSSNRAKRYNNFPLCVFYYTVDFSFEYREATQIWRKKFLSIANKNRDITFAIASEDAFESDLKALQLEDSGEELNFGCFGENNKKYRMEPMEDYDADEIQEFLDDFKKGKIPPVVKSQPVPKKQGPVAVVVGKNFEKVVLDEKKDVLIEFYAPWCGHCKSLEPIYKKLGKKFQNEKDLVIAKIDATANDSPEPYSATGFPTIFFAPKGDKQNPIKFEGERTLDGFVKFLKEKSTVLSDSVKDEL
ncbi:unnamed protein product [Owenia fusiformis]|uniref:Protein disulfide-isomerase n=1 Tax=Owenia fusiformis TaxID=6347 RepID=A0A8J1UHL6_OWEFU|nr:unnamed protein product [Owenia fusiformis]